MRQPLSWVRAIAALGCLFAAGPAAGQFEPPVRGQIYVPPSFGATPLSTVIHAEAAYIAASGAAAESFAIARRHHAFAAEHEMRNSLLWVQTYFERKALNRAYRLKQNPPYLDRLDYQKSQTRRRLEDHLDVVLRGNVGDDMNWLLREMAGMSLAYQFLPGDNSLVNSSLDAPLSGDDLAHIRLSDGGRSGHKLVFRADSAEVLDVRWPRIFRAPEFDEVRQHFESVRDAAVEQIQTEGQLTWEMGEELRGAVDGLSQALVAAYPPELLRVRPFEEGVEFTGGKRFLQSLAGEVFRTIETNDARLFDGSFRFEGDSVVELLHHVYEYGLEFAPPEPGDEGTYQKVFLALRGLYLDMAPEMEEPVAVGQDLPGLR